MREKLRLELPSGETAKSRRSFVIAVVVHALVLGILSTVLAVPVFELIRGSPSKRVMAERVTYLVQPPVTPPRDTGSKAAKAPPAKKQTPDPPTSSVPVTSAPPPTTVAVTSPTEPPTGITPPIRIGGGDSVDKRVVGKGIPLGLGPGVRDPRTLPGTGGPPGNADIDAAVPYRRIAAAADSATHAWLQVYWDSVARAQMAPPGRNMADWTKTRGDGTKYGVDPQWIYFGKFKVPTMLLALLPINLPMGNPSVMERQRALESMRREITYQAMRAPNQTAFTNAVKELRERKEREYQARQAAKKQDK